MAQRFSSKDILGTLGGMRKSGSTYASPLRSEKKLFMKNPKLRALIANPSRTYSATQARAIIGTAQQLTTETGEKQKLIARYKSAGTEVRKMAKTVLERSAQQQHSEAPKQARRYDAGSSDEQKEMKKTAWEQRLEKAREKGERRAEELEKEGRAVAVRRREVAERGTAVARREQIEVIKERQEAERKKELTTLADKDPKKLSGHAVDLGLN